ncbi:hypothetical protein N7468_009820 [Penicillium chermesinum]|uniref:Uncharacterized protein n=1 Tax=Penicillium chermesinum TaxID=63820 RepID=A0A9W9TBM7_9EURO|nr:uncharacterized protein N7468_009820 [Penicillium chermesinum]KAJ5216812.1 hypothetical protein N7468_009820 [Penicillium chermesinum]
MVTSWSPEKQDVLELFVQSKKGLTENIRHRAALEGHTSLTAFVSGPYGVSKSVDMYECILAVATDFGIAGVISYLKKLLYGYNTSTSHVRRVHFVWQVQTLDIAVAAQPLLNSLLSDDVLDDGYVKHGKPFGHHRRATVFNGTPHYENIIAEEASGRKVRRLANTHEVRGDVLVLEDEKVGLDDLSVLWEDEDPIEWDTWLATDAFQDNESPNLSYFTSNYFEYSNQAPNQREHTPRALMKQSEGPLLVTSEGIAKSLSTAYSSQEPNDLRALCLLDRNPQLKQPTDEGGFMKESATLSICETLMDQHGSFQLENGSQHNALSLTTEAKPQSTKVDTPNSLKQPVLILERTHEYTDCIKTICEITTGQMLTESQSQEIKNCGDDLLKAMQSEGVVTKLKLLLAECHMHTLLDVDSNRFNSSVTACVTYLACINSITGSGSNFNAVRRRIAQVCLHIHFENLINSLKTSEKKGFPIRRNGRSISTIARDSILQALHGHPFFPRKTDRDILSDQCRWGERWWKMATCIGLGVLILATDDLASQIGKRTAFRNKMVDTLGIYLLNRYPSIASLYQIFEPFAVGLMLSGDRSCSHEDLDYFLQALIKSGPHKPDKPEKWHLLNLESQSQLAASRLVLLQRSQATITNQKC